MGSGRAGGGLMVIAGMRMVAAVLALSSPALAADCDPGVVNLRWPGGEARFSVEVADDDSERALGLMNRERMATSAGMLFVYETPRRAVFWMQNTLIPLDMIFADADGRVTAVHANAVPLDETPIDGGKDVKFVLEINGGLAARLGVTPGAELRHPSIGATAVWPCGS